MFSLENRYRGNGCVASVSSKRLPKRRDWWCRCKTAGAVRLHVSIPMKLKESKNMAGKIREKNACKGVEFTKDVHEEFDVLNIPFKNLELKNPLRVEWQKANPNKDWSEDKGREGVAMRPTSKDVTGKRIRFPTLNWLEKLHVKCGQKTAGSVQMIK